MVDYLHNFAEVFNFRKVFVILILTLPTVAFANDYALDFDGSNDYVSVANNAALNPTDEITVSAWIKASDWEAASYQGTIVGKDDWFDGSSHGYVLRTGDSGRLTFVIGNGSSWPYAMTEQIMATDTWYHVVGTFNGTDIITYVNGEAKASYTMADTAIAPSAYNLEIGRSPYDTTRQFDGKIDEVAIWNYARTQQEILNNMNVELEGDESGLVAYYKMSNGSGTTLTDNSSNTNNGTLTNMNSSDWVSATSPVSADGNYSLGFDGSNDYVQTTYGDAIQTIGFWFKTDDFETSDGLLGQRYDDIEESGNWQMHWDHVSPFNKLRIYAYNSSTTGGGMVTTTTFQTNTWYHIVVTSDGTNVTYYVNGIYDSQHSFNIVLGGGGNDDNLTIGGSFGNSTLYPFDGHFDEVAIWNEVLDADAITAIYNLGTPINLTSNSGNYDEYTDNLVGYWRFAENNGTTAYDISGEGNHGTLTNGPTYVSPGADQWISTVSTGNWNTAGTWVTGSVPSSDANIRIRHNVTMDVSPTAAKTLIDASKTLTCGINTLTVSGTSDINGTVTFSTGIFDANSSFDATGGSITISGAGSLNLAGTVTSLGTLSTDNGTVTYDGTTQTIFSDTYNRLILSGGTKTPGGDMTVNGNLTLNSGATLDMSTYNITIGGNLSIANGATWTKGSGTTTFNPTSSQTLSDNNGTPQNLGTVVVD